MTSMRILGMKRRAAWRVVLQGDGPGRESGFEKLLRRLALGEQRRDAAATLPVSYRSYRPNRTYEIPSAT